MLSIRCAVATVLIAAAIAACTPAGAQVEPALHRSPSDVVLEAAAPTPASAGAEPGAPPRSPALGTIPVRSADAAALAPAPHPERLRIPRLGIDMTVQGVGIDAGGAMELPASAEVAGWFRAAGNPGGGPRAGRNAVIAAHVDDAVVGLGPFARLREARPGDAVRVRLDTGRVVVYRVAAIEQTDKREVDLAAAFAGPDGALVLVTCGGRWDADVRHYEDNVLVWAYPEGTAR
ncbi:class F sortase [Demequina silvatica]|uniref:class F sortase n=1 Tax=Demequina silvatica TaxID=1638988 RepID=UPI000781DE1A|nr:class F sortase [Demequina silvatica]